MADRTPRPAELPTEFSDDQYQLAYPDGIENHWWHLARHRILADTIRDLVGPGTAVLDVGCGRGIAVRYLRGVGIDCIGVELGDAKPVAGLERHVRVRTSALDLPAAERQRYTAILLLDVLEHVPDVPAFLQALTAAFPNLTHVIVTVPARPELWTNYDDFYGHYRRYTLEMLRGLSHELRTDRARESYFFHSLYAPAWLAARLKRKRTTRFTSPRGFALWAHKLIAAVMVLDYKLFPKQVPGSSALACFFMHKDNARRGST